MLEYQPTVRCCAVMPQDDASAYAYQPEEKITREQYNEMVAKITPISIESYSDNDLSCEGGACPIEFDINNLEEAAA